MKKAERIKLKTSMLDEHGREINNPKPLVIVPDSRPTLQDRIKRCIREELSAVAKDNRFETFEEANDFDIENEFEQEMVQTSYQMQDELIENQLGESEVEEASGTEGKIPEDVPQSGTENTEEPPPETPSEDSEGVSN